MHKHELKEIKHVYRQVKANTQTNKIKQQQQQRQKSPQPDLGQNQY